MKQYEAVFIIDPVLSESQVKETVHKLLSYLEEKGGSIIHKEFTENKHLSYPVNGKKTAFYSLLEFQCPPDQIKGFEIAISREEKVMKHLITSMDKHAVAFAKRRRINAKNKKIEDKAND